MKHIQTYESFKKTYGQRISPSDFKKIPVGKNVHYMGSRYEVVSNDGYILSLKREDGLTANVNLGQFNQGGQINEAYVGPFVFNDKMSDEELKVMYNDAVTGYANWQKGFQYPKTDYKKAYQEIEKILKKRGVTVESLVAEGQFSWMTLDTDRQIGSERENTITVYMFSDKGEKWQERRYEGYGVFGGKDYYELLAQMNGVENADRQDGIDIAFGKQKVKGKILFPALVEDPKFNWKRHDFTKEPENDPNQSWYQEDEEDDYNESTVNEAASVPSNIMDFAKRKGSYAVNLVKKAATWAEKAGKYISGGTAIGKDYDTIILDMKHQGSEIYINLNDETIELFGEEVTDPKSFKKVLDANG